MSKSNDTYLNILASYAYLANKGLVDRLANLSNSGKVNVMIDSGAFTAHNASGNFAHVNVEQYTDFCLQYEPFFEKFVMLDVLGNEVASKRNYEYMVKRGAKPMFVLTVFDNDFDYLRSTMAVTPPPTSALPRQGARTTGLSSAIRTPTNKPTDNVSLTPSASSLIRVCCKYQS